MLPGWMIPPRQCGTWPRAELFQRALQGASVAFHARRGAFAKQGTSIAVCLLVIDKRAGPKSTAVINRATV
jgi:hypothetical protein